MANLKKKKEDYELPKIGASLPSLKEAIGDIFSGSTTIGNIEDIEDEPVAEKKKEDMEESKVVNKSKVSGSSDKPVTKKEQNLFDSIIGGIGDVGNASLGFLNDTIVKPIGGAMDNIKRNDPTQYGNIIGSIISGIGGSLSSDSYMDVGASTALETYNDLEASRIAKQQAEAKASTGAADTATMETTDEEKSVDEQLKEMSSYLEMKGFKKSDAEKDAPALLSLVKQKAIGEIGGVGPWDLIAKTKITQDDIDALSPYLVKTRTKKGNKLKIDD